MAESNRPEVLPPNAVRARAIEVILNHFKGRCLYGKALVPAMLLEQSFEQQFTDVDSLDILELALVLEDEFDIDLVDTPITLGSTPGELLEEIERLVNRT